MSWMPYDDDLALRIASKLDLRRPNLAALRRIGESLVEGDGGEFVCDLATGVGKTYISAALIEYLAAKGVRNILIVTPGRTIQEKTVSNFTPGTGKYIAGGDTDPVLITSENFSRGQVGDALQNNSVVKLFVFNVQQLIRPGAKISRKVRDDDEFIGGGLYEHLQKTDDLVIIADEHHIYRESAKAFNDAVRDLRPRAIVGLTATPDQSDIDAGRVVYRYSLAEAIADQLVKIPVIVYRQDGLKTPETQLADACQLRKLKEVAWHSWADAAGVSRVTPVIFVVCQNIRDAKMVAEILSGGEYLPGDGEVLLVTSESSDEALRQLASVEDPASKVRAIVSVDKLKEGWDVKNIGVIVGLRALASETLTEQILGRGLRLPYGKRVGNQAVDTVDLVSHDSYRELLSKKDVLLQALTPRFSEHKLPGSPDNSRRGLVSVREGNPDAENAPIDFVAPGTGQQPPLDYGSGSVGPVADAGDLVLELRDFESVAERAKDGGQAANKRLEKVAGAPEIIFPRREMELVPERFSLSLIRDADARRVGSAYLDDPDVYLKRVALTAVRDDSNDVILGREFYADEKASLKYRSSKEVRADLEDRLLSLSMIESSLAEARAVGRVVTAFLDGAGVSDDTLDAPWSEQRAKLATRALENLVVSAYHDRRKQPEYRFRIVRVPVIPPPVLPSPIEDRFSKRPFRRHQWYEGWQRSIEPAASFDAKSTEYALADNFDASSDIKWWLRTYTNGEVWIEWSGGKYFPDFIVIDDMGVHWLVEGKADDDAYDSRVQAKKNAAEDWARFVRDSGEYGVWRYLFATESIIKQSAGSWTNLKRLAQPEL